MNAAQWIMWGGLMALSVTALFCLLTSAAPALVVAPLATTGWLVYQAMEDEGDD